MFPGRTFIVLNGLALSLVARSLGAADSSAPVIAIHQASGPITIDGDLSDEGWKDAAKVETWFETNPRDNVPPTVRNVGHLTYDDRSLYAAFEFDDPDPSQIRAPFGDRDNVPSYTDYGGVILDTRDDGKTGILFLANPRGIQYDAVSDDVAGNEDSSPDFFWDAAARITKAGWVLEMRVPFSSLRYSHADPQSWGIMLYRNYPRAFRYQMFSTRLPRGGNCFICRSNALTGLRGLPSAGHLVLAPYASGREVGKARDEVPGNELVNGPVKGVVGLDVKWTPGASTAMDVTLNPDFSQIESDVAQIAANERFALFFPEKRPFFLEGIELFSTPIPAVYTRTITSPQWGLRATGKFGAAAYTALVAQDEGGGSAILPGPNSSDLADQEFRSWVGIGRVRRDIGRSFVSVLATAREVQGGGHNRVLGPDFQWRANGTDTVTGQALFAWTRTPNRPELTSQWDGRELMGHGADLWWSHSTTHLDWFTEVKDFTDGFRAEDGFVPQVGYRQTYAETGYTFHPEGLVRRLRTFAIFDRSTDRGGDLLNRSFSVGAGMDGRWSSFVRLRYASDRVRAGDSTLPRRQLLYTIQMSPSRKMAQLSLEGFVGQDVDFDNARRGTGAKIAFGASLRPTDHLELRLDSSRRWLDVDLEKGREPRLFTACVDRLRATYTLTSRAFLRLIVQYVDTRRDLSLYEDPADLDARESSFTASGLLAYKLNWQTVLFLGYGNNRALAEDGGLGRESRELFVKLSYAFQR